MRRLATMLGAVSVAVIAAVSLASPASASDVPPHDHWLTTGSGTEVHVGPYVCKNPAIYDAWLNFHINVHTGVPGTQAFRNDSNPASLRATLC